MPTFSSRIPNLDSGPIVSRLPSPNCYLRKDGLLNGMEKQKREKKSN